MEGSQDGLIGLISGHGTGSNIADQPSVALSGFELADNSERSVLSEAGGSGDGPLATAGGLTEQKADTDGLGDTDDGEKAGGGGGGQEGGLGGDGRDGGGAGAGGGGGLEDEGEGGEGGGGQSQSEDEGLEHLGG